MSKDQKDHHFRLAPPHLDQWMDLYWGGPEHRITGLTVRIIALNVLALLILVLGILYLGQYQKSVIEARLETFQSELVLIADSLSKDLDTRALPQTVRRLSHLTQQRIIVFDHKGQMLLDSKAPSSTAEKNGFRSVQVLKDLAKFILQLLPDHKTLLSYPFTSSHNAQDFPDAGTALKGQISLSAWEDTKGHVFLSAAAPLQSDNNALLGAVLLTREGRDIEAAIEDVWIDVLKIFSMTFVLTILLSIYLSGTIARPLRKLSRAAEAVRRGQAGPEDIPDMSTRFDEIGELSVALRQMTGALHERMDLIDRFAADVAHELKNPLTSLRSAVETALIVKTSKDREKLLNIIRHDVDRLSRLITDISAVSRLDSALSREVFEKVNLVTLLHVLLHNYEDPLVRQRIVHVQDNHIIHVHTPKGACHIHLENKTGEGALFVWGLETRLGQVFQNLIDNALSFSPQNGIVHILIDATRTNITLTIEDQGIGIPEGKLESIFERFYSERPAGEDYGQHSGLGLSICKQIIKAHGGKIFAQNIKDAQGQSCGARFIVVLKRL